MPPAWLSLLPLCLLLLAAPAAAQPAGTLTLPPAAKKPEAPHAPPKAAPVPPVHHGSASGTGKKPTTPVVNPKGPAAKHPPPHGKAPAAPVVVPAPAPAETKPAEKPAEQPKGASGLPLPRFAALRADEVNMRTGPGTRYPIEWVYKRRELPMEIEREFEVWRLVRDQEGVKGWVHQATLTGRRTVVVTGAERPLRRTADDTAGPVAMLKPGVIARIRACPANGAWCEVQVGDYRGWLKRDEVWGVYPNEEVKP